jgi:hypothetical protein
MSRQMGLYLNGVKNNQYLFQMAWKIRMDSFLIGQRLYFHINDETVPFQWNPVGQW